MDTPSSELRKLEGICLKGGNPNLMMLGGEARREAFVLTKSVMDMHYAANALASARKRP